jgi:hypothetical protein
MTIEETEIGTENVIDVTADEAVQEINVMITSLLETIDEDHRKNPDEIQEVLIDEIAIDVSI